MNNTIPIKSTEHEIPVIVIRPIKGWSALSLREIWEYRELLYFLAWRDVKVRYKQTFLGAAWAIIQPFMTMVVFSIFFGRLAKVPSDNIPYPIFAYSALVPWSFFAHCLGHSSNSLVGSQQLIKKVYFPRMVIPISSTFASLPDFLLAFIVLMGMMVYYGLFPTWPAALLLPVFLVVSIVTSLGVGLWLSALNVQYRDVHHIVPFLTQFWLFITPIAYPSSMLSEPWRSLYGLNPMAGVVEGFRWGLLGKGVPPGSLVLISALSSVLFLKSGMFFFRRMEKTFADIV